MPDFDIGFVNEKIGLESFSYLFEIITFKIGIKFLHLAFR